MGYQPPLLGPQTAATSTSVTQTDYHTPVLNNGGANKYIAIAAAGGTSANYWVIAANKRYELRVDPDLTGGKGSSDPVIGVYKLDPATTIANDDDGDMIVPGERIPICVGTATRCYVRLRTVPAGLLDCRFMLFQRDG
jgi:hypothetical protein